MKVLLYAIAFLAHAAAELENVCVDIDVHLKTAISDVSVFYLSVLNANQDNTVQGMQNVWKHIPIWFILEL